MIFLHLSETQMAVESVRVCDEPCWNEDEPTVPKGQRWNVSAVSALEEEGAFD